MINWLDAAFTGVTSVGAAGVTGMTVPTAKSLNDVSPVACVLVEVLVPVAVGAHVGALSFLTSNLLKSEDGSMSAGTNVNAAL